MQVISLITINVTVYQGTLPGDAKRDIVVGSLSVPMLNALKDGSVNAKMALELHEEETNPYEVGICDYVFVVVLCCTVVLVPADASMCIQDLNLSFLSHSGTEMTCSGSWEQATGTSCWGKKAGSLVRLQLKVHWTSVASPGMPSSPTDAGTGMTGPTSISAWQLLQST